MKKQNALIILAILLLTVAPLWLVAKPPAVDGEAVEIFKGADDKAKDAIGQIAPQYEPWFAPLLEPASGEIASLLFALQAALGTGVIGYWLGCAVTRDKLRKQAEAEKQAKDTRAD